MELPPTTSTSALQRPGRILFVHYNAHSTGSARERIITLVKHLAAGREVIFFLPEESDLSQALRELGIQVVIRRLNENSNVLGYLMHALRFGWYCFKNKIRLIHILDHTYWKPAELLAARVLRVPFISMITFPRPEDAKNGAVRWADLIVANSRATAADFIANGLGEKTQVIYNAVDCKKYQSALSIREELFPDSAFLAGFVGVLHPVKGIDRLLQAFAVVSEAVADARLAIIGPEKEPGYRQYLQDLVADLAIGELVRFHDYRSDIPQVMKSLDLLVVPSREEPFGFVLIEAGAAKTPIVASAVGGIPEIVRDQIDGLLVPADDQKALAEAMLKLLNDTDLRAKLSQSFQERVQAEFSYQKVLAAWDQIYAKFLGH